MKQKAKISLLILTILGIMTSAFPSAQAVGVTPIVVQGWLLGGVSQGKFISSGYTAKALKGGETYQLCTLTQPLGRAQGSKPKHNPVVEVGPEFRITFTPAPQSQEPVVAVGGTWKAMPRQPRLLTGNLQAYIAAAAEILKSKGIANPQVILTQVIEIDLDGDGIKEVLVGARRFTMAHLYDALNDGDYSMIFLQQKVGKTTRNILIEGQFQAPSRPKTGLALTWQAVGLVDADGDGVMEIAVNNKYYEGGAAMLYKLKGDKSDVDMVFYEDWGA